MQVKRVMQLFKIPAKFYLSKIIEVSSSYENMFLPLGTHYAISVATLQTGYFTSYLNWVPALKVSIPFSVLKLTCLYK